MERKEGIVRWSPYQTRDEFLKVNLTNHTIHLYKATGHAQADKFDYSTISKHSDIPDINGYDWSPNHRGLLAIGTPLGEVRLLRVDDNSNESLTLPLRFQRACQAVTFNTTGLLAVGLDRVRNDACLQIWDVNERLANWDASKPGLAVPTMTIEPRIKIEGGMSVTSVRFFEDSPQTLICGIRNQSVKIYDLRDPNSNAATFQTRCNNNIALDYVDSNYFASSTLDLPGLVIFDRRAAGMRNVASPRYNEVTDEGDLPWGAVLKLDRIIEGESNVSVKQMRFSREHRGALGVLSTSGQLQILQTRKEYIEPGSIDDVKGGPELLEIKKSYELQRAFINSSYSKRFEHQIVSFDWIHLGSMHLEPRVIGLQANGEFKIFSMPTNATSHLLEMVPWAQPHQSGDSRFDLPYFRILREREEILGPLHATSVKATTPVFGPDSYSLTQTKINLLSKVKNSLYSEKSQVVDISMVNRSASEKLDQINLVTAGYLFDCQKNKRLVGNDSGLADLWEWISGAEEAAASNGMVSGSLDLSYLGVYYIWTNQLGKKIQSRMIDIKVNPNPAQWEQHISSINEKNERPEFDNVETLRPQHRQLCLAICGNLRSDDEILMEIDALIEAGDYSCAACLALFEGRPDLSVKILYDGGSEYFFIAMALDMKIQTKASLKPPKLDWEKALDGTQGLSSNVNIRAISHYIATSSWEAVVEERCLPLRQRVALALRHFTDDQLTNWLEKEMEETIRTGDVQGVVLAGITDPTVSIMAKYVEKCGDYQTAILALSFCYPRYISDVRCDAWREEYRAFLNRHRRFIDRVKFDQELIKKSRDRNGVSFLKPSPRQVTIRCQNCDQMTTSDPPHSVQATGTTPAILRNPITIAGINAGLKCPRCGVGLPRCVVCMHHVLGQPRSDRPELSTDPMSSKATESFPTFCMNCKHVMHMDHALLWFKNHEECPVSECRCRCNDMVNR
ncbi:BgTH12-06521 [Blumeria graminis f. sp. triticale]|uniref:Bgt-4207 n=3 Tax=Blumeria graminis TaxID=34373 RepID=A0A061HHT6_BLUGR|nr:hypothetical protein BGT96224_4207 [Blumeria graminis f. sp. tritici 96224]CAD6500815.1 BgTH12-06521 [Blumeria graminis f. sp. triticale]VCU41099.1 Bgt-4207 [Blumeria graminis f. sp. tritici]